MGMDSTGSFFNMYAICLLMIAIPLQNKSTDVQQSTHLLENYFCLGQMISADSAYELKDLLINPVKALRNEDKEKALYVDYSSEYSFPEDGAQ